MSSIPEVVEINEFSTEDVEDLLFNSSDLNELPEIADMIMGPYNSNTGIILIHGLSGTNLELLYLANKFVKAGYRVFIPLLPGHGSSSEELKNYTANDWIRKTNEVIQYMIMENPERELFLAGHSLGATLALYHSNHPAVVGIMAISAPIRYSLIKRLLVKLLSNTNLQLDQNPMQFFDNRMKNNPLVQFIQSKYNKIYFKTLHEVFKLLDKTYPLLNEISKPVIAMQSIYDETVPESNLEILSSRIDDIEIHWLSNSYHVPIADIDKDLVASKLLEFVAKFSLQ